MKTLLLPILDLDRTDGQFALARAIARQQAGVIRACYPATPEIEMVAGDRLGATARRRQVDVAPGQARAAEALVHRHAAAADVEISWDDRTLDGNLGAFARAFDAVVLPCLGDGPRSDHVRAIQSVVLEGGRPTLLAGQTPRPSSLHRVAVCWNSSAEAARAVSVAAPLLAQADTIKVLVTPAEAPSVDVSAELTETLRRHGAQVEQIDLACDAGREADAIAGALEDAPVDLAIRGAYTRGPVWQRVFGGTTRALLSRAPCPLLLAH